MLAQASMTPVGLVPRFKRFTVAGIFSAGSGFNFDSRLAFIHLSDAQALFHLGTTVSGLKIKLHDIYAAPRVALQISEALSTRYQIGDWTQEFGAFFKAITLEILESGKNENTF